MTSAMMTQLRRWKRGGNVEFYEQCQVVEAQWLGDS